MMKVHHVGYLVKRLEKAEKAFSALGYVEKQKVVYDPIRDVDISFWEKDGYTVELVCPKSEKSVVANLIRTYKNAPYHICYETDDLEAEMNKMEKTGFMKIDNPTPAPAISGGGTVLFLYSAQIGFVELLTYEQLQDRGDTGWNGCGLFRDGDGRDAAEIPRNQRGCESAP